MEVSTFVCLLGKLGSCKEVTHTADVEMKGKTWLGLDAKLDSGDHQCEAWWGHSALKV